MPTSVSPASRLSRLWAGEAPDPQGRRDRLKGMEGFTAEEGRLVGFMTIDAAGFIDLAFVAPAALAQGEAALGTAFGRPLAALSSEDRRRTPAML